MSERKGEYGVPGRTLGKSVPELLKELQEELTADMEEFAAKVEHLPPIGQRDTQAFDIQQIAVRNAVRAEQEQQQDAIRESVAQERASIMLLVKSYPAITKDGKRIITDLLRAIEQRGK